MPDVTVSIPYYTNVTVEVDLSDHISELEVTLDDDEILAAMDDVSDKDALVEKMVEMLGSCWATSEAVVSVLTDEEFIAEFRKRPAVVQLVCMDADSVHWSPEHMDEVVDNALGRWNSVVARGKTEEVGATDSEDLQVAAAEYAKKFATFARINMPSLSASEVLQGRVDKLESMVDRLMYEMEAAGAAEGHHRPHLGRPSFYSSIGEIRGAVRALLSED